jgi:hypothetical protein
MSETPIDNQDLDVSFYPNDFPNQALLARNIEHWFTQYGPDIATLQMALYESHVKSLAAERVFASVIKPLTSVFDFAQPLLNQAIQDALGISVDSRHIYLHEVTALHPQIQADEQPILIAALHNFRADKTFLSGSGLYYRAQPYPPAADGIISGELKEVCGTPIDCFTGHINYEPSAFVNLCRSLDLGGQYETHLTRVFANAQEIENAFVRKECRRFEVLVHIARMRNHISPVVYDVMLRVAKTNGTPVWGGGPLRYSELELFATRTSNVPLQGVLIIESHPRANKEQLGPDEGPVVVYMPGEPRHPVKEYATINAFLGYLRDSLSEASYRRYLERFLPVDKHADFFARLNNALTPRSGVEPQAGLAPHRTMLNTAPFNRLYDQAYRKIVADARTLAVPVRTLTDPTRHGPVQVLRGLAHFGFDLADVFLPASEIRDLVKDIFTSLEDWSDGDRTKTLAHLYDIGKHAVLAGAPKWAHELERLEKVYEDGKEAVEFIIDALQPLLESADDSSGFALSSHDDEIVELEQGGAKVAPDSVSPSAFVESLVQVEADSAQPRLWKPDLTAFKHPNVLPAGSFLDGRSLLKAGGQTWLSMAGNYYEVGFDSALKKWRVLHSGDPHKYSPVLETNGHGAWRFEGEDPMGWDAYKAFRRLHGDCATLEDDIIDRILRITEVDEALLRQIHVDKLPPPALLVDCTQRFLIVRHLNEFIGLMGQISNATAVRDNTRALSDAFVASNIEPYLEFIVTMPGWPEGRVLRRLNAQGAVLSRHGVTNGAQRNLDVVYTPGNILALLDSLMLGLSATETESLLISYEPPKTPGQYLAYRLGAEARGRRQALFDLVYATKYNATNPIIRLVQRDFPSLPYLVVKELVATADEVERDRMSTAERIPLRLAEQAREYLQQLRINRALECFYLHLASPDSDIVTLALVNSLPDWPKDLVIEVRRNTFDGQKIFRSGGEATKPEQVTLVMVQNGTHYETYTPQGQRIHFASQRLSRVLSSQDNMTINTMDAMEIAVGDLAISQRPRVKRALGLQAIKPGIKWPLRLPDGRVGYPLSGRLRGLFDKFRSNPQGFSPELAVRRLYPQFTSRQVRAFLDLLSASFVGTAEQKKNLVRGRLNELGQEYSTLEATLDRWVADATYTPSGQMTDPDAQARNFARVQILSCWRRESVSVDPRATASADSLDLRNLNIGSLPVITAKFGHVQALTLENLALTTEAAGAFVRCFPELRSLSLQNNRMDAVPAALEQLSSLKTLKLSRNLIQLDAQGLQRLQNLRGLETLELEGHDLRLDALFDVSWWPQLAALKLRLCGLTAMPSGLGVHAALRLVDLRHNRITTVGDQTLLAIASRPEFHLKLHGNPLDAQTIASARNIFPEVAMVRMGVSDMPGQWGDQTAAQWLVDSGSLAQRQRWADLQREPEGESFVQLVKDLVWTADYRDNRQMLVERLWRMIDEMSQSEALREELFELAAHPETCGDGTMVTFNMLDVRVLVSQLERTADGNSPIAMFKLMRGLERLDELDRIALRDFNTRLASDPYLDQAEVRLIYPTQLRVELALPGQAQGMLFANISGVDQQMIDRAKVQVLQRERQPAFLKSMIARNDWMTFLETHYQQRFEMVTLPFHELQDKLDDQRGSITDEEYLNGLGAVYTAQKQGVEALALELTKDIAQLASTPE